jgi:hypothetical protein
MHGPTLPRTPLLGIFGNPQATFLGDFWPIILAVPELGAKKPALFCAFHHWRGRKTKQDSRPFDHFDKRVSLFNCATYNVNIHTFKSEISHSRAPHCIARLRL